MAEECTATLSEACRAQFAELNTALEQICPEIGLNKFECTVCGRVFDVKKQAMLHCEEVDLAEQITMRCADCNFVGKSRRAMFDHYLHHHNKRVDD